MARRSNLQPLTLDESVLTGPDARQYVDSPRTPQTPKSPRSPRSPFKFTTTKKAQLENDRRPSTQASDQPQQPRPTIPSSYTTPSLTSLQRSTGPAAQEGDDRERPARTGFFSNYKASKSSSRLQPDTARPATEDTMSRDADRPVMARRVSSQETTRTDPRRDRSIPRKPVGGVPKSDTTIPPPADQSREHSSAAFAKKNKPKPFSLLNRTKSIREDERGPRDTSPNGRTTEAERIHAQNNPIRTAPLRSENDRSFRDMMNSNIRQHSADRHPSISRDEPRGVRDYKEIARAQASFSASIRESGSHGFLTNLRNGATKGAGALSKGLFGKGGRSGSMNEKETTVVDDEHYQIKVINKPLIEQTRLTRISKRLEDSRDKTEFWMPAFPWRAIDYLNYKGSDVEGLYRVPGSGPQIKRWQRRFDEELDIDLFEQEDLYDINIVGSMLKAWLRELPDELLPKSIQDRVSRECGNSQTVPQLLVDELSNLSPFNYYLLFAITCHLSLLLAHSEKNKMDFRNLCICFQPCMKIDSYCFKFLVCDWRDCWKGCKTEAQYIEAEYQIFKESERPPNSAEGQSSTAVDSHDERNVSSSDSSKPSILSANDQVKQVKHQKGQPSRNLPTSERNGSLGAASTSKVAAANDQTPPRKNGDMRPLSPIKPLSPIGF